MPERRIDLHTHSLASDGTDAPAELARKAAAAGLAAFALTDHDTVAGLDEAGAEAETLGLEFIPGIEIAVRSDFGELHLLGLWVNPAAPGFAATLAELRRARDKRNRAILDKLAHLGLPLSMAEVLTLARGEAVGRPHIAAALRGQGYVRSRREAFERYLARDGKAYVPRLMLDPNQGLELLAAAGATTVLAHPCLAPAMTRRRLDQLLALLCPHGLQALEVWHCSHDPNQTRFCLELASKYGLLPTGGSDYHGQNKEGVALGTGRNNLRIPYSVLEALRAGRAKGRPPA